VVDFFTILAIYLFTMTWVIISHARNAQNKLYPDIDLYDEDNKLA